MKSVRVAPRSIFIKRSYSGVKINFRIFFHDWTNRFAWLNWQFCGYILEVFFRKHDFQKSKKILKKLNRIQKNERVYLMWRKIRFRCLLNRVFFSSLLINFRYHCYAKSMFLATSIKVDFLFCFTIKEALFSCKKFFSKFSFQDIQNSVKRPEKWFRKNVRKNVCACSCVY